MIMEKQKKQQQVKKPDEWGRETREATQVVRLHCNTRSETNQPLPHSHFALVHAPN